MDHPEKGSRCCFVQLLELIRRARCSGKSSGWEWTRELGWRWWKGHAWLTGRMRKIIAPNMGYMRVCSTLSPLSSASSLLGTGNVWWLAWRAHCPQSGSRCLCGRWLGLLLRLLWRIHPGMAWSGRSPTSWYWTVASLESQWCQLPWVTTGRELMKRGIRCTRWEVLWGGRWLAIVLGILRSWRSTTAEDLLDIWGRWMTRRCGDFKGGTRMTWRLMHWTLQKESIKEPKPRVCKRPQVFWQGWDTSCWSSWRWRTMGSWQTTWRVRRAWQETMLVEMPWHSCWSGCVNGNWGTIRDSSQSTQISWSIKMVNQPKLGVRRRCRSLQELSGDGLSLGGLNSLKGVTAVKRSAIRRKYVAMLEGGRSKRRPSRWPKLWEVPLWHNCSSMFALLMEMWKDW